MDTRRVFIVGETLFAETLAQTLSKAGIEVRGFAATPEEALPLLVGICTDALILVGEQPPSDLLSRLFLSEPDLPLIFASLSQDRVHVLTHLSFEARSADLISAITALPKRK